MGLDLLPDRGVHDAGVVTAAERVDVEAALQRLSRLDRRLIALRYDADLTQASIADLLGMPLGTVKVRLHRARRALASALAA